MDRIVPPSHHPVQPSLLKMAAFWPQSSRSSHPRSSLIERHRGGAGDAEVMSN